MLMNILYKLLISKVPKSFVGGQNRHEMASDCNAEGFLLASWNALGARLLGWGTTKLWLLDHQAVAAG